MNSKTTRRFRRMIAKLTSDIRRQAKEAYELFMNNPNHPSLRFKKVHTTEPIYSARINIEYRVLGVIDRGEIVWFWIGTHAEYDKLLSRF